MRIAAVHRSGADLPALVDPARGVVTLKSLGLEVASALELVEDADLLARATGLAASASDDAFLDPDSLEYAAPYRRPHKIWGIGLNYRDHAADLSEEAPDQPASFIKADHTVCGQCDSIVVPRQSQRTTAEGELGLVIGTLCRDVDEAHALEHVWGVTTILDQTAEDILRMNPRFLTRSKNFPTFFCFGPELVPLAEVLDESGALDSLEVSTVVNGTDVRTNTVAHMTHRPEALIAFHSQMMPLYPGDIISTGTPGAIVVDDGDEVECRIPRVGALRTTVVRQR